MTWLGEEITAKTDSQPRRRTDAIEEALYAHRRSLFGEIAVAFFDTTSLYFEGRGGATLGQRGHSKDFRPQLNQVVLGIVLDEKDRPIASFLWPGNTADVTTLLPVVECRMNNVVLDKNVKSGPRINFHLIFNPEIAAEDIERSQRVPE